jgi:hypothetical protein
VIMCCLNDRLDADCKNGPVLGEETAKMLNSAIVWQNVNDWNA